MNFISRKSLVLFALVGGCFFANSSCMQSKKQELSALSKFIIDKVANNYASECQVLKTQNSDEDALNKMAIKRDYWKKWASKKIKQNGDYFVNHEAYFIYAMNKVEQNIAQQPQYLYPITDAFIKLALNPQKFHSPITQAHNDEEKELPLPDEALLDFYLHDLTDL